MLHHGLRQRAIARPDSLAVKRDSVEYSYGGLDALANRTARELLDRVGPGDSVIGILSPDPAEQLTVMFAVWKAGKTVVILDPSDPEARLQHIAKDAGADLLVAGEGWHPLASRLSANIMVPAPDPRCPGAAEVDTPRDPDHPALILYTSGSTGRPKGIVRTHANILVEVRHDSELYNVRESDRVSLIMPLHFGYGLKTSLMALLRGAALISYDVSTQGLAPFADWFYREKITLLNPPLSYFRTFLNTLTDDIDAGACRCVVLGGERLFKNDVEKFRRAFPRDCRLIYTYGATESGNIAAHVIQHDTPVSDPVPVGSPVQYVDVRVVDENGSDAPPGEAGEILVIGSNLPPGYWKNPALTRRKYRTLPGDAGERMCLTGDIGTIGEDGLLYLHGREDTQLKVQGYRVDLAELDTMLNSIEGVSHAVAIADDTGAGEKQLVAFVTLSGEPALDLATLRKAVAARLPRYMLPDEMVVVEEMPFTSRGKVDKQALVSMVNRPSTT